MSSSADSSACTGVGAVYYAQVGLRRVPEDRTAVRELIVPVVSLQKRLSFRVRYGINLCSSLQVYFIVLASVVVHGITIPIFKRKFGGGLWS